VRNPFLNVSQEVSIASSPIHLSSLPTILFTLNQMLYVRYNFSPAPSPRSQATALRVSVFHRAANFVEAKILQNT